MIFNLLDATINPHADNTIWVVDNFYSDPYKIREFALQQQFEESEYHRGKRTRDQFVPSTIKQSFESIMGKKITNWTESYGMSGRFQYCTAEDALVYHADPQQWAAVIYLTPDAPYNCGTSLIAHKKTGVRHCHHPKILDVWKDAAPTGVYLDSSKWEEVDVVGNVFNRLVIWDGHCPHTASKYFGFTKETSRLFHIFFFDAV